MRNALAHLPDFTTGGCSPNIRFDESSDYVSFSSDWQNSRVEFRDIEGFTQFLTDFIRAMRKIIVAAFEAT